MEAMEAFMEAVEASTEAFTSFHAKNKQCRRPLPDHSILDTMGRGVGVNTILSYTVAQYRYLYKLRLSHPVPQVLHVNMQA